MSAGCEFFRADYVRADYVRADYKGMRDGMLAARREPKAIRQAADLREKPS